jgi:hypothetical protein
MKTTLFILLLIPFGIMAQIGAKVQQQEKIHGLWQNSQFGYQMTLMLNADGSGEFDGEMIKFTAQANKLAITQNGATTNYTYNLQGNSLTLTGGDLDQAVTFSRNGAATQQTAAASTTAPPQKKMGGVNGNVPLNTAPSGNELIGVWSGNGETIEFKTDGNCIYLGNTFPYEISQGHVILTSGQGKAMFAYTIKGTQLVLTANGQQVVYNKGAAGNAVAQNNGTGNVAMELVGKWCYVNVTSTNSGGSSADECITLNQDGTYVYYSERSMSVNTNAYSGGTNSQNGDRGTWYVQGDRIFYNSQSQGQGSYRLEKRNHPKNVGDPMIVLDGKAFVTATYRQPWR